MSYFYCSEETLDDKPAIMEFMTTTKIFMTEKSNDSKGNRSVYKQFNKGDLVCRWNVKYNDTVNAFDVQKWQITTGITNK